MASDGAEKSEKPTERRRKEARRKGQIARSPDLAAAAATLALFAVLPNALGQAGVAATNAFRRAAGDSGLEFTSATLGRSAAAIGAPLLTPFLLVALTVTGAGLAASFLQVGFHASLEAAVPKFQRVNPLEGTKRLLSKTAAFEGLKALAKLAFFSGLAYGAIAARWPDLLGLPGLPLPAAMGVIGDVGTSVGLRIGGAWFVIAAADYAFQRRQTEKSLMMTKDEVRQEMKDQEMSPELKSQRNAIRKKMSKRRVAQAMKEADVVVTNPTHYSVAIKYEPGKAHAPVVVAKGVDHLAFRIRELAAENRVPVVPNPPLARALYRDCDIGDFVPREWFAPVAEVLAYVYRTLGRTPKT